MKIAFITSRFPFPVEKGDKLRAFHHIRWLGDRHEVHLFALTHQDVSDADIQVPRQSCASVSVYQIRRARLFFNVIKGWIDGLPAQVAYFLDQRQKRRMQQDLIRLGPDHIFAQLIRTSEYVRILPVAKTLDYMDVFSVGSMQRAETGNWFLRPFFAFESKRLQHYERSVYTDFSRHMIISTQDRDRLPLSYRGNVAVISNGVDYDFFAPLRTSVEQYDVLFVGNMGYLPNIEAAEYLISEVMPHVWQKAPDTSVCLAGARPHRRVQKLRSDLVQVTGWVEDVRPYYNRSRVFAAPMFTGLGLQNKILEAMAMEVPCITTPIVDKAIGGSAEGALWVAEDAITFAEMIIRLLQVDVEAEELGKKGRAFVKTHYDWPEQNQMMENLLSTKTVLTESETLQI
jgi:sugar transferase (PEP-CTERM/EpsH1 system associated)